MLFRSFNSEDNIYEWILDILQKENTNYENIIIVSNGMYQTSLFIQKFKEHINKNITVIDNEPNYVDLMILSMCNIIVCSNSTFSFWSAALSDCVSRVYISPEYKPANCRNSIPPGWLTNSETFYKYYKK